MTDTPTPEQIEAGHGSYHEPVCPFCGRDPYEYVDIGVGHQKVAVTCCEMGIEYFDGRNKTEIVSFDRDEFEEVGEKLSSLAARVAELEAQPQQAVTVKALEWDNFDADTWWCHTEVGTYRVNKRSGQWSTVNSVGDDTSTIGPQENSEKAAKATAQADYERRILSAVTARPEAEVWDEAIEAAARMAFATNGPRPVNDAIRALKKGGAS